MKLCSEILLVHFEINKPQTKMMFVMVPPSDMCCRGAEGVSGVGGGKCQEMEKDVCVPV